MKVKVSIVMLSHLNDFKIDGRLERIDFVTYLITKFPDTSVEIDADQVYQEFLNRNN